MREAGRGDECDIARLEKLLEVEDVCARDRGDWMALHWAAMGGSIAVIQILIRAAMKAGFDYGQRSRHGATPKDVAIRYGNEEEWKLCLMASGIDVSIRTV